MFDREPSLLSRRSVELEHSWSPSRGLHRRAPDGTDQYSSDSVSSSDDEPARPGPGHRRDGQPPHEREAPMPDNGNGQQPHADQHPRPEHFEPAGRARGGFGFRAGVAALTGTAIGQIIRHYRGHQAELARGREQAQMQQHQAEVIRQRMDREMAQRGGRVEPVAMAHRVARTIAAQTGRPVADVLREMLPTYHVREVGDRRVHEVTWFGGHPSPERDQHMAELRHSQRFRQYREEEEERRRQAQGQGKPT